PIPTQSGIRSGSPRESGATSALAKALTIASMRLFGASSSPPSWKHGNTLIGFTDANSKASGPTEVSPEELAVVQAIEDTAHKAYVQEPSREAIMAEEAFFLYLRSLALLQAGMDVARRYWEERRQDSKPASTRLNSGVQWIRDRFNECLEKAEAAKSRSGIDHREGSGVIIEKLIYERALELSKNAAMKEISSDEYSESERSYQTSIWMLHAILDGAGADGQSEAIEEDDREILNKFIRSIEGRLNLLRRRAARG
ncbi:Serine/threonine-protein kinase, partial [Lunasporangiospora selenospora]